MPGSSAPSGVWTTSPNSVQDAGSIGSLKLTAIVGRGPTKSSLTGGSTAITLGRSVSRTMLAEAGAEAMPALFSTFAHSVFVPSPAGNVHSVTAR